MRCALHGSLGGRVSMETVFVCGRRQEAGAEELADCVQEHGCQMLRTALHRGWSLPEVQGWPWPPL